MLCHAQPAGHKIVSGYTPSKKMRPTTTSVIRKYLMRSAVCKRPPPGFPRPERTRVCIVLPGLHDAWRSGRPEWHSAPDGHAARVRIPQAMGPHPRDSKVEPLGFYSIRHRCATALISEGLPITAVARRLGHADAALMLRIYAKLMDSDQARCAAAFDSRFADRTKIEPRGLRDAA